MQEINLSSNTTDNYKLWENRYNTPGRTPRAPELFVVESLPFMQRGKLLDVACGEGRHALYLAAADPQFEVLGLDRSPTAIKTAQKRANLMRLSAQFAVLDLEEEPLPPGPFQTIVVTRYWQEDLCPKLVERLAPGGCLVYESYTLDYLRYGERTCSHLLKSGQLRESFQRLGLIVDFYAEVDRPQTREYSARLRAHAHL